jgi:hypothetical protein
MTDFWERMRAVFGPHADSVAELHVLRELGNRTPVQALAAGEPAIEVWRAVCAGHDVPVAQHWGRDD